MKEIYERGKRERRERERRERKKIGGEAERVAGGESEKKGREGKGRKKNSQRDWQRKMCGILETHWKSKGYFVITGKYKSIFLKLITNKIGMA